METKSIRATSRLGGVSCEIIVTIDGQERAYRIHQPKDSEGVRHPWYMVDGKRRDLKPNEIKAMKDVIKEVLDDGRKNA